jgi:hypothetical protein
MWTVEVVVVQPGRKVLVAFFEVGAVTDPLAESGLDEAFGSAIDAPRVEAGSDGGRQALDRSVKTMRAEAMAVVGDKAANGNAVPGIKGNGRAQKLDRGFSLLIGHPTGRGEGE